MAPALFDVLFLETFCNMDTLDSPRFCPSIDGVPYRYSVGFYRGKRRVILGWFADQDAAMEYLLRFRRCHPRCKADLLQSLF